MLSFLFLVGLLPQCDSPLRQAFVGFLTFLCR